MKRSLSVFLVLALLLSLLPMTVAAADAETVEFAVLSTTDIHGKCWDTNVLTGGAENNNMLRVSTAVAQYRETYGDNLLVIDNGDLYQGTPVSVVQLGKITSGESDLPPAMALCLAEIGYDASVLGNHEFNYPWTTMTKAYDYLASRGVPVITANLYYDGSDGVHQRGENVFQPYLVKTFKIGDTEHKIGVLGFENTDCTRWDVPDNYPGIVFAHPDNTSMSMAWEAQRYIPQMKAEGCEFIIVSYHSGTGSASGELVFGQNTEGQVTRMITECEGIDMVIAGHDHSSTYSNTYLNDKNGKPVLVVNGGGQQLTQSVFSFREEDGVLRYDIKSTQNLKLANYASDEALKAKLQPYADMAEAYVNQTAGTAVGTWDTSSKYYLQQTDTMDLINCAQMDYGTKYLAKKYDTPEKLEALYAATGLDHLEVDMSSTSAVTSNSYYVQPGEITMKTIVQMYRFDNNVLYLLPLTGAQIKAILEQNASTRLKAVVRNGSVSYTTIGENFTNPVFGGLNFTYDMYQPEGSRVVIEGFSNGRAFDLEKTYIVACNSYHLGNTGCGFGAYSTTDSIWNQNDDLAGGNVQEVLLEYIQDKGEITTEPFTWSWKLDYTGDPDAPTELVGDFAAKKVDTVADGDEIVIYYDAESTVIGLEPAADNRRLDSVNATVQGEYLAASDKAAVFTVGMVDEEQGIFTLKSEKGYLTTGATGNSLGFGDESGELAQWKLEPVEGGFHIMSVGVAHNGNHNQAIEWYTGFTTYGVKDTAIYLFNIYKLQPTAKRAAEIEDGGKYAIYYDDESLTLADTENSGGLGSVKNTVSGPFLMLPVAENTLVVTAHVDAEGRIDFTTDEGKHLTSGATGNSLSLTDELAENDCSLWTLTAVEGGFHIMNVGANYNGNHNQALEYYSGKFTVYGVKDTGAYLFNLYQLPAEEEPDTLKFEVVKDSSNSTRFGHVDINISVEEFLELFQLGDIVTVTVNGFTFDAPVVTNYDDVDTGNYLLRCANGKKVVTLAINYGQIGVRSGLLEAVEGGYAFKEGLEWPMFATVELKQAGGYADELSVRKLTRTNERSDYADLSDAAFANFRAVATTGMGENRLYRSSSPIDPDLGRNTYADAAAKEAGVKTFINLADTETDAKAFEGYADTYYATQTVKFLGLPVAFTSDEFKAGLAEGYRFIAANEGPYLIHCLEGKDRTGLSVAVLEALMGAGLEEIQADYLQTYVNYFEVQEHKHLPLTEAQETVLKGIITKNLGIIFDAELTADTDLAAEAEAYLTELGLTTEEIAAVKTNLGAQTQRVEFEDVQDPNRFYYVPVYWAVENEITNGMSATLFAPDNNCTRGQVVTFLWRAAGKPGHETTENPFTDVDEKAFYYDAVLWAVENEITNGMSATTFAPNGNCTRGQVVTFLYRFAGKPTVEQTASAFTDLRAGAYYTDAVAWAVANDITNGLNATTFAPENYCNRGQVVTFLYRQQSAPAPTAPTAPTQPTTEG